ncbi:MAG TPA: hypothetical protein VF800_15660 [Telluria sp.]|jgi:hypothetical protein
MTDDIILFLRAAVADEALQGAVARLTGMACSNEHVPGPNAPALFIALDYQEGFLSGFSLSWPASLGAAISVAALAQGLADQFATEVLFDAEDTLPGADGETWRLAAPGGQGLCVVAVRQIE